MPRVVSGQLHVEHEDEPFLGAYFPSPHGLHAPKPGALDVPAGHGSHALAPEFYKTPRGGAINPRYLPFVPHFSFFGGPPGSNSFIDLALHKQEVYMRASPPRAVVYTKTLELFDLDHWRAAGEVRLSPAGRQRCEALCELAPQTPNLKKQLDRRRSAVKTFQAASSPFGDWHHAGHGG